MSQDTLYCRFRMPNDMHAAQQHQRFMIDNNQKYQTTMNYLQHMHDQVLGIILYCMNLISQKIPTLALAKIEAAAMTVDLESPRTTVWLQSLLNALGSWLPSTNR